LFDIGLARRHIRLIGFQLRDGGIEILLRGGVGFDERSQPVDILLCLEFIGFGLRKIRFRLQQQDLPLRELSVGFTLRNVAVRFGDIGLIRP
jgi:hypothetical protein